MPSGERKASTVFEKVLAEVRSGLVSSVFAEAALFPLDTVKLRLQVEGGTAVGLFRSIVAEQGVLGLYQGLIGRLIQTITSNVGFFIWQTVFMQYALSNLQAREDGGGAGAPQKLGTALSLVVNMLAQQLNRILTTPVDVVANVNQADPASRGFFHTFAKLARTGGREVLWRGLGVSLLLSLNPALMFTLVGKLSAFLKKRRGCDANLGASDMFWISGISKGVATLLTYPLIRAKAVLQTGGSATALWPMLTDIVRKDGVAGLYHGVWIMSYKTVLFNSLMMATKQQLSILEGRVRAAWAVKERLRRASSLEDSTFRENLVLAQASEKPWMAAERKAEVIYADGSWSLLHAAQEHILFEASKRCDHLVVGIHSDEAHHQAVGTWPAECFAARLARLQAHPVVSSVLRDAPWEVPVDLIKELGITKVVSGSLTKMYDCATPQPADIANATAPSAALAKRDPYAECRRLGIFEEIQSLNESTEHEMWVTRISRVLFSNVDASIDWRILVADGAKAVWGQNPGYGARR